MQTANEVAGHNDLLQMDWETCAEAAGIFHALGDPARLQLLTVLLEGEQCVTALTEALGDNISAVSQRLKLLRSERIVRHRRQGKHIYYSLADEHIAQLIHNGLAHAREIRPRPAGCIRRESR